MRGRDSHSRFLEIVKKSHPCILLRSSCNLDIFYLKDADQSYTTSIIYNNVDLMETVSNHQIESSLQHQECAKGMHKRTMSRGYHGLCMSNQRSTKMLLSHRRRPTKTELPTKIGITFRI